MHNKKQWIGFYTMCRYELARIMRIWPQTLLPPLITTALYYIIFGNVIGNKIGNVGGVSYIQYIMPGLVMMNIIDHAYINVQTSFFISKFFRSIEELLISPMPQQAILCGFLAGGIMRALMVGILVGAMSLFFTQMPVYHWGLTVVMVLVTSLFMSLLGFVNGVFAKNFDDLNIVPLFVILPLSFFGGVFYSVDMLPSFWQIATHANPIFYMIGGFRYAILGTADVAIEYSIGLLSGGVLILYAFCLWLLRKGVGVKP